MRQVLMGAMAAAVLAASGAARAQPPASNTVDDLTVVGRKSARPPPSFASAVTNYVAAHARASAAVGNLSRWMAPVCPFTSTS